MNNEQLITLGGGCFWCIEDIFSRIKGVVSAISGYEDGDTVNPTYEEVCTGITNHAEVVEITFEPDVLSVEQILDVFFAIHDPTTLNRQGNDIGTQYRSVILYHNNEQKLAALAKVKALTLAQVFDQPIVTDITEHSIFYPAENYHQGYFSNNPQSRYCQLVVAKKVQKFLQEFPHLLKS